MSRGLNEEETTVNTSVLNISIPLGCKFLSQICRMLIFDVLNNRIPTVMSLIQVIRHTIYHC